MCGINGFWETTGQASSDRLRTIVQQMSKTLLHRGPDDSGNWVDESVGIALGHQRLAIVDLSPEGNQPMVSADGRYALVFNGEIYNFLELRLELESLGHCFRGHSDTEVMLASFSQWELVQAIERFNGMFAFALWDRRERVLHLGRDRLGEKPLYYGWMGKTFLFGSELKAFKAHPRFQTQIDRNALTLFLQHSYVPAPYSIYQGIYKLPPGTVLTWNGKDNRPVPVPYWSAKAVAELGVTKPLTLSEPEALAQLDTLLRNSVKLRMVADVPLGAFLSGGIDSSTVVALMQAQSSLPVKTFTIGFYEDAYNEAQHAKAVAQYLGTEHTELYVTPAEALAVIPQLPIFYDEPFADVSQIPTFLLAQLTKTHVTVSLSGDGGDELFAGYSRYFWTRHLWQKIGWMPSSWRSFAARAITSMSSQTWNRGFARLSPLLPIQLQQTNLGDKLHKLAEIVAVPDAETMYARLISLWQAPEALVVEGSEPLTILSDRQNWAKLPSLMQRMMYLDTITYLPDDILVKVDRASMGVSLEARVPLLDHRVVEFAWRLPLAMKIRNSQGKFLLRQLLYQYVPKDLINRPKMGFGVPVDCWLRGSLRDWAEALLDRNRLQQEGFFQPQAIERKWKEHLSGDRNWQYYLWNVLVFQAWLETTNAN
ncbi:MAG: Asparagine synthetase [glutamine-hydrolyzing] 1 [Chroococcidiopsis sp. SAG 2025]|uniref:asparagine synthase (glutamine-hydrolyzing) n=1 Tax=Chroococcidiopsis sp. SAG 2025 TaxID=171389 RepID=UPI002936EEBC|nr:asparagine synthase (glutamine-hydrolyzing) [Chroococcidiopsis sp. SAG 2025]MDV2991080.1 Asparagine synthetase [glutamine-hydrolyzing] 1 [Chroococcidiopsis sp. SAG 2025]